ncbi:MAG: hypothetical protein WCG06_06025, partial [Candidatus Omnitrophota bacterium]
SVSAALTAGGASANVDRARTLSGDAIGSAEYASDYAGRASTASTLEEAQDFARQAKAASDKTKDRIVEIQSELTESL